MTDFKSEPNRPGDPEDLPRSQFEDAAPVRREPIINAPGIVILLAVVLLAIHAALEFLPVNTSNWIRYSMAFVVQRYMPADMFIGGILPPGGELARYTSFVSYSLLHGSWTHLILNIVWMLAFGSVAARRLGAGRFLFLSALAAAIAATFSLVIAWGTETILVGASGAIAGQVAVAIRLIFSHGGTLSTGLRKDLTHIPPEPLLRLFTNKSAVIFIAIWLGVDIVSASSGLLTDARVAWEAHLGGFLTGLLLFGHLDPHNRKAGETTG